MKLSRDCVLVIDLTAHVHATSTECKSQLSSPQRILQSKFIRLTLNQDRFTLFSYIFTPSDPLRIRSGFFQDSFRISKSLVQGFDRDPAGFLTTRQGSFELLKDYQGFPQGSRSASSLNTAQIAPFHPKDSIRIFLTRLISKRWRQIPTGPFQPITIQFNPIESPTGS